MHNDDAPYRTEVHPFKDWMYSSIQLVVKPWSEIWWGQPKLLHTQQFFVWPIQDHCYTGKAFTAFPVLLGNISGSQCINLVVECTNRTN